MPTGGLPCFKKINEFQEFPSNVKRFLVFFLEATDLVSNLFGHPVNFLL